MGTLREDIRMHPVATALALALWGAITWLVGRSWAFSYLLLLLPVGVPAFLIGRWRRTRGARSSGIVAALIVSLVLLDLSIAVILVDQHIHLGRSFWRDWGDILLPVTLGVHVVGLASGCVGWWIGHEAVYPGRANPTLG